MLLNDIVFEKSCVYSNKKIIFLNHMHNITIGMTAYNSERFIEDSIKSLLIQTTGNFKLIISDDASTDNTDRVCKNLMLLDDRIHYIRQEKNLGPRANFEFVFNQLWSIAREDHQHF